MFDYIVNSYMTFLVLYTILFYILCEYGIHLLILLCYDVVMELNGLIATGLSKTQAAMYALLIEKGEITPPEAAIKLKLSRTNAYKLLDKLVELKLAARSSGNKTSYQISNPTALASLAANLRAEATARENAVTLVMKELVSKYYSHTEQPGVEIVTGNTSVANSFRNQIALGEDIYFVRSLRDVTSMGFDIMHELRTLPSRHGLKRFGILPDGIKGPVNYEGDKQSNLKTTWVKSEDYDMPVEWSVTKSSLLIVLYGSEPYALTISNPLIAGSFLQIWHLLDSCLKAMPYYESLPRLAS